MTRRRGEDEPTSLRPILLRLLGLLVLVAAWGGLVVSAIAAGRSARDGSGLSWLWMVLAGLGAVIVLIAALSLAGRLLRGGAPQGGKHR